MSEASREDLNKFAKYMIEELAFSTGHGDTMEELLKEFDEQIIKVIESERNRARKQAMEERKEDES